MKLNEHQKAYLNDLIRQERVGFAIYEEKGLDLIAVKYKGEISGIYSTLFLLGLIDYQTFNERSEIK